VPRNTRSFLAADHPELAQLYRSTRGFTATKGMDAQTVIHFVIILFILIGNNCVSGDQALWLDPCVEPC